MKLLMIEKDRNGYHSKVIRGSTAKCLPFKAFEQMRLLPKCGYVVQGPTNRPQRLARAIS